ncbi:hypothetical protein M9Y10_025343 [Tritrichomonas musculus]|uniref:Serine/threonine-protein kinase PLK n=1 Tax=Tritrichomonas musculus TaxID=1915356 RepID=A0ABR2HB60_9EUKA
MSLQIYIPSKIIHTNENGTNEVYLLNEKIGQGGFSVVHRVTDQRTNQSYAMKVIPKERYSSSNNQNILDKLKREIQIQKKLNHPNIVKLKSSFSDDHNQYMILEYCPGKSIFDYLKKTSKEYLTESQTKKILKDVLEGLLYLHNHKIIHQDLKLENFLIASDWKVKIGDFGVSTVLKNFDDKNFSLCGTANYMSPELLEKENKGHGFEVDIWTIGVSTFLLLTGQYPFSGFEDDFIYEKVKNCDYCFPPNIPLSEEAKSFIQSIFVIDSKQRPKVIDLLKHPFLAGNDIPAEANNSSLYRPSSIEFSEPLKKFSIQKVSPGKENAQLNDSNVDFKKNFIIPDYFVIKHLFYYEDLGYLLGDGTVGVCFSDHSRIVIDPNEKFVQYYQNYNSKEEVFRLGDQLSLYQRNVLKKKISIVLKFSKEFKKFGFSYNLNNADYDPGIPLHHVKLYVAKNDSILFKLNNRNIQMNCSDHKKLIVFCNSKKMCLVNYLKERCCLLNISDVAKNRYSEEYQKLKESKELVSSFSHV